MFPEELFQGEAVEEWVALSGSQGEEKEGALNIILSYMVGVCVCGSGWVWVCGSGSGCVGGCGCVGVYVTVN